MQKDVTASMFQTIKGTAIALALSLLSAVVFAAVLRATALPDSVIYPVNQAIKALSIVVGVLCGVRGERGFWKGGAIGLAFTALSYLAFSALGGDFSASWLLLAETATAWATGALCGALAVNARHGED